MYILVVISFIRGFLFCISIFLLAVSFISDETFASCMFSAQQERGGPTQQQICHLVPQVAEAL